MTHSLLLLFILICSYSGYSQVQLFEQNELPTERLYRITQDHDGFVWIISDKGIIKYDGINTRVYTTKDGLPTNDVFNIRITDDNRVWFFNYRNEQGYIYKDSVYNFFHENLNTNYLWDRRVVQEKNELKILDSNNELTVLRKEEWKVVKDPQNKGGEVQFLDHELVRRIYNKNDSLFTINALNEVHFLYETSVHKYFELYPENLLFSLNKDGLLIVDLATRKCQEIDLTPYNIKSNSEIGLHYLNGAFQVSGDSFLALLDSNFQLKVVPNLPNLESYTNAMSDQAGNAWYLNFPKGVYFCPSTYQTVSTYSENSSVTRLTLFNNAVYFISNRKRLNSVKNGQLETSAVIPQLYDLYAHDSTLWTFNYSIKKRDKTDSPIWEKPLEHPAKNFFEENGRFFINEARTTSEVDTAFNTIQTFPIPISGVVNYRDTIFIGTYDGLYFLSEKGLVEHSVGFDKPVTAIDIVNDRLIIGTDGFGIFQYRDDKVEKTIDEKLIIERLTIQGDSVVLAATNEGAYLMQFENDSLVLKYVYTVNDGLRSNLINDLLIYQDSIYIGTNKGLSVLKYGTKNNHLRSIYLQGIKWNNGKIDDTIVDVLHANNNSLEINYSAIYYAITNNLKYSYCLAPISNEYIETAGGKINLRNLEVGEYKLRFKVEDRNYELTKTITINIRPRWFQTMLFKVTVAVLVLLSIFLSFLGYRKYIVNQSNKRIKRQKQLSDFKLEALRSQMNPHFVFNSLNAIQYYISENQNDLSEGYLVKFSKLIRQFFDLSDLSQIPLEQEVKLLQNYLDLEQMRFADRLNYNITVDSELSRKNVFIPTMILQPLVENAINHGIFNKETSGSVKISFKAIDTLSYEVSIEDDGIGMEQSKALKKTQLPTHNSKSTLIFKERIELLNSNKEWFISYTISNAHPDPVYPGTLITLSIQKT